MAKLISRIEICEASASKEDHVKHQQGKNPVKGRPSVKQEKKSLMSIFSSGGQFVQLSGTILAILVKKHKRNIFVKLFWN